MTGLRQRILWGGSIYLAGMIAGGSLVYWGGPQLGTQLAHVGDRLMGLERRETTLVNAQEIAAVVRMVAEEEITNRLDRALSRGRGKP
jgi:hypothetical protein